MLGVRSLAQPLWMQGRLPKPTARPQLGQGRGPGTGDGQEVGLWPQPPRLREVWTRTRATVSVWTRLWACG